MVTGNDYFLPFEKLIRSIIYKNLITTGFYDRSEFNDLSQEIFLDLTNRQEKILGSYRGLAQFSTYLYMIVIRKCSEMKRLKIKDNQRTKVQGHYDQQELERWFGNIPSMDLPVDHRIIIEESCRKLQDILDTYGHKKQKLVFSMKSIFRLLVNILDLREYNPASQDMMKISGCIVGLNESKNDLTDQEIYLYLTLIFNLLEHKSNTNDAIRKWLDERMHQIVVLLNKPPAKASFDRETLQILFERCFATLN